jgi:hypothetical protein
MRASIIVIISVGRGDRTRDLESTLALSSREMGISVRCGGAAGIFNGTYSKTYRAGTSHFIFINIKFPPFLLYS